MFGKSIQSSTAEPSFFYLMMAATCFRRAASTRHPQRRHGLSGSQLFTWRRLAREGRLGDEVAALVSCVFG
jgi:transposase-like protein